MSTTNSSNSSNDVSSGSSADCPRNGHCSSCSTDAYGDSSAPESNDSDDNSHSIDDSFDADINIKNFAWRDRDLCILQCAHFFANVSRLCKLFEKFWENNILKDFMTLIVLLMTDKLSCTNLTFLLCLERARFESLESSTQMRFRWDTKQFWATLLLLGKGFILHFLAGRKSAGNVLNRREVKGKFNPRLASVNFAVPSRSILKRRLQTIPNRIPPGFIEETARMLDTTKQHILMFDAKKISPGLGPFPLGDVDLCGAEGPLTVADKLHQFKKHECTCKTLEAFAEDIDDLSTVINKRKAHELLKDLVTVYAVLIQNVQKRIVHCNRQILKLQSYKDTHVPQRYDFAIGNEKGYLYVARSWLTAALELIEEVLWVMSHCQDSAHLYRTNTDVSLTKCSNFVPLHEANLILSTPNIPLKPSIVKQRSEVWYEMRANCSVSASSAWNALGLRGLSEMKKHFKNYVLKSVTSGENKDVQERMKYGSENEIHAVATNITAFMPAYLPKCYIFQEQGSYMIDGKKIKDLICVSPDGMLICPHFNNGNSSSFIHDRHFPIAFEAKCPYPSKRQLTAHYVIPTYYSIQILLQMKATSSQKCWYLSYTPEVTVLHEVKNDIALGDRIYNHIIDLYDHEAPRPPKSLPHFTNTLRMDLEKYLKEKSSLLSIGPSKKTNDVACSCTHIASPYHFFLNEPEEVEKDEYISLRYTSGTSIVLLNEAFQICREKGQEIVAGVITNTSRIYDPHIPTNMPIIYGLKSFSMSAKQMRKFVEYTRDQCKMFNIDVLCEAYDGAWASLVYRSINNEPLTRMQLHKQIWQAAKKLGKKKLIELFKKSCLCTEDDLDFWSHVEFSTSGDLVKRNMQVTLEMRLTTFNKFRKVLHLSTAPNADNALPGLFKTVQTVQFNQNPRVWHSSQRTTSRSSKKEEQLLDIDDLMQYMPEFIWDEHLNDDDETMSLISQPDGNLNTSHNSSAYQQISCAGDSQQEDDVSEFPNVLAEILSRLKVSRHASKYSNMSERQLYFSILSSSKSIGEKLTVDELNVVQEAVVHITGKKIFKKSASKQVKVNRLATVFGDSEKWMPKTPKLCSPRKLKLLAEQAISSNSYPSTILQGIYASHQYKNQEPTWESKSPIPIEVQVPCRHEPVKLFCYPEYSQSRDQVECRIIDPTHVMNNLRSKICRTGIDDFTKDDVIALSKCHDKQIRSLMLTRIIDQQNAEISKAFFSSHVEQTLRQLGRERAAEFVRLFRGWFEACDSRGLDPVLRIKMLLDMQEYLLRDTSFSCFPPTGRYWKGIPVGTVESIIHNASMRIILYKIAYDHNFCNRAVSTVGIENLFSELSCYDFGGKNCPKATQLEYLISKIVTLNHVKHSPAKKFKYDQRRGCRYPHEVLEAEKDAISEEEEDFRHNLFDLCLNTDGKKRVKGSHDRTDIFRQEVGADGVRVHYRIDTSKVPVREKLGIEESDLMDVDYV